MDTEYCLKCGVLHDPNDGKCLGCEMQKKIDKLVEMARFIIEPMSCFDCQYTKKCDEMPNENCIDVAVKSTLKELGLDK